MKLALIMLGLITISAQANESASTKPTQLVRSTTVSNLRKQGLSNGFCWE
jgi:hypothetical protein